VGWKDIDLDAVEFPSKRSILQQIKDSCKDDSQAQLKGIKSMEKKVWKIAAQLDDLGDDLEILKQQAKQAQEQNDAINRLLDSYMG